MATDTKTLLAGAVERARQRALQAFEAAEKKAEAEAASKVETWKTKVREREDAERTSRNKAGLDITEEFLKEIAGPFARYASRDDASKLANIEINLRPGKTGDSASFSIQVKAPGITPKVWHRASIESLDETQKVMLERLHQRGGLLNSSPMEMMQEIVKLRETLMQLEKMSRNVPAEEAPDKLAKVHDVLMTLQLPQD